MINQFCNEFGHKFKDNGMIIQVCVRCGKSDFKSVTCSGYRPELLVIHPDELREILGV